MSRLAVRVVDVSKHYRIGELVRYSTLRETLTDAVTGRAKRWFGGGGPAAAEQAERDLWALRNVSFEVHDGEVLGLIGRNGAGKSTMLKILSRITEPTSGYAELHGRVGSLLEVGTGFHPELTGRENIFLNGAILGMKRAEIRRKLDEIVDFAEVERFIDTPVKRYSDGMYMRLAFSVAAHLEPEILIVDEVLAVGDAAFQQKCLGRMDSVAKEGRTVLFVSHNMLAVQALCQRVVWLDGGRVIADGRPAATIAHYLRQAYTSSGQRRWDDPATAPGNGHVRLHRAAVLVEDGAPGEAVTVETPFRFEFEYWNLERGGYVGPWLQLYNADGVLVFEVGPDDESDWDGRTFPAGRYQATCRVPGDLLNSGLYRVVLQLYRGGELLHEEGDVLVFEIADSVDQRESYGYGDWGGAIRPRLPWTHRLVEPADAGELMAMSAGRDTR